MLPHNLIRIAGNRFDLSNSPPWDLSVETTPLTQNNSNPQLTEPIIIEKCPYKKKVGKGRERLGPGGIAMMAGGGGFAIIFAALFVAICKTQICAKQRSMKHIAMCLPVSKAEGEWSSHMVFAVAFLGWINRDYCYILEFNFGMYMVKHNYT